MVDFIEAFEKGQTAAEIARKNNQEINSVFDELNRQLDRAIEGKVEICFQAMTKTIDESNMRLGISSFNDFLNSQKTKKYTAICAINPSISNSPKKELAEWEKGKNGYPCKIITGNQQHYCEDKTELENALALMLQDPIVGKALSDLISFSENQ
jgi:hypothetical protein